MDDAKNQKTGRHNGLLRAPTVKHTGDVASTSTAKEEVDVYVGNKVFSGPFSCFLETPWRSPFFKRTYMKAGRTEEEAASLCNAAYKDHVLSNKVLKAKLMELSGKCLGCSCGGTNNAHCPASQLVALFQELHETPSASGPVATSTCASPSSTKPPLAKVQTQTQTLLLCQSCEKGEATCVMQPCAHALCYSCSHTDTEMTDVATGHEKKRGKRRRKTTASKSKSTACAVCAVCGGLCTVAPAGDVVDNDDCFFSASNAGVNHNVLFYQMVEPNSLVEAQKYFTAGMRAAVAKLEQHILLRTTGCEFLISGPSGCGKSLLVNKLVPAMFTQLLASKVSNAGRGSVKCMTQSLNAPIEMSTEELTTGTAEGARSRALALALKGIGDQAGVNTLQILEDIDTLSTGGGAYSDLATVMKWLKDGRRKVGMLLITCGTTIPESLLTYFTPATILRVDAPSVEAHIKPLLTAVNMKWGTKDAKLPPGILLQPDFRASLISLKHVLLSRMRRGREGLLSQHPVAPLASKDVRLSVHDGLEALISKPAVLKGTEYFGSADVEDALIVAHSTLFSYLGSTRDALAAGDIDTWSSSLAAFSDIDGTRGHAQPHLLMEEAIELVPHVVKQTGRALGLRTLRGRGAKSLNGRAGVCYRRWRWIERERDAQAWKRKFQAAAQRARISDATAGTAVLDAEASKAESAPKATQRVRIGDAAESAPKAPEGSANVPFATQRVRIEDATAGTAVLDAEASKAVSAPKATQRVCIGDTADVEEEYITSMQEEYTEEDANAARYQRQQWLAWRNPTEFYGFK